MSTRKYHSCFKEPKKDLPWFFEWASDLSRLSGSTYIKKTVATSLGETLIWSLNEEAANLPALIIFPGFRTTPLFWDLDRGLRELLPVVRVFLVETNGQPNPSEGNTPDIRSDDYGRWAEEIVKFLQVDSCYVAGASFGGLVAIKLGIVAPDKVKSLFLFNPGCLTSFSLKPENLFYNLLPILFPTEKNISRFLQRIVFGRGDHTLSRKAMRLIISFQHFALTRFRDRAQKPYAMKTELRRCVSKAYLFLGESDKLFPYRDSRKNAEKYLSGLQRVDLFPGVGHGIETYKPALRLMADLIQKHELKNVNQESVSLGLN